jgi:hypothetical protein
MPTYQPDLIQINRKEFTWTASVPANLNLATDDDWPAFTKIVARYEVDAKSHQCYLVTWNFQRVNANWLNGCYSAKSGDLSFQLLFRDGKYLNRRINPVIEHWSEMRRVSDLPALPDYEHWRAITIRESIRNLGLSDTKQVLLAYRLSPNHHAAVDEFMNRSQTKFACETAARLNRMDSRPVAKVTEKDYYDWVESHATHNALVVGGNVVVIPRLLPQSMLRLLVMLVSRLFVWKPILIRHSNEFVVLVGGHRFSREYHMAYFVSRKASR